VWRILLGRVWRTISSWADIGERDGEAAMTFMDDLAKRLASRV
jgi:hypothetical protein